MIVALLLAAPEDEDVVAGPIGFVIFIGLCLALAVLGWSLNKHLKKAHRAEEAGVYGGHDDSPSDADTESGGSGSGSDGATGSAGGSAGGSASGD